VNHPGSSPSCNLLLVEVDCVLTLDKTVTYLIVLDEYTKRKTESLRNTMTHETRTYITRQDDILLQPVEILIIFPRRKAK
jgi:hypothetical protein